MQGRSAWIIHDDERGVQAASGFLLRRSELSLMLTREQVEWKGRQHLQLMAKASDNYRQALHYECGVCHTHMYVRRLLHCTMHSL